VHRPLDQPSRTGDTLKADPAAQQALLELQALDAKVDLLRHQRETLPEIGQLQVQQDARAQLDNQRRDLQIQVDDLTAEQARVDGDVEQVKTRRQRDRDRMDQGLITNPKDLERMQGELVSLERRITSLEDDELEVMARLEDAQSTLDDLAAQITEIDNQIAFLTQNRDRRAAEIDEQLAQAVADRGPTAASLPDDLLALYDRLRAQKGGVGAAELRARQCGGCRLTLDNAELAVIRAAPADEVVRCEECQRILVRTPESGL
jgi:predicted  nucleic acid-binding Zn-ribbon protein